MLLQPRNYFPKKRVTWWHVFSNENTALENNLKSPAFLLLPKLLQVVLNQ